MLSEIKLKQLVKELTSQKPVEGCTALEKLLVESRRSATVAPFLSYFLQMIDDENSYVRNRGLLLAAANAQWDKQNLLEQNLGAYLDHLADEKPITVRQCLKGLQEIARLKPQLRLQILRAVKTADMSNYSESMRPLLEKDLKNLKNFLEN